MTELDLRREETGELIGDGASKNDGKGEPRKWDRPA